MNRFEITDLPLSGLKLIQRQPRADARGFLSRIFCAEELKSAGWNVPVAQINQTHTARRGTLRGMHYQKSPYEEVKLVSCLRGEIWDVAVDLRANSSTYLHWHAELLSEENHCAMLIPQGFAHGFQTLTDNVELLYCHSAPYQAKVESGLHPQDSALAIDWPLPITEMSERDRNHEFLNDTFTGLTP